MRSLRRDLLVIAASLLAVACDRGGTTLELTGATMGTSYAVALSNPPGDTDLATLETEIGARLDSISSRMSTYEPESELSRFNARHSTDWLAVSAELCLAIRDALAISDATMGAFDITVGPLVDLWGFGPSGTRTTRPAEAEIALAMSSVGYEKVETDCNSPALRKLAPQLRIDMSAYAKGLAVDQLAELLDRRDLSDYLVEIGGEVRARGTNSRGQRWRVAIEQPAVNERKVQRVLSVTDKAVATSGDYRNFFIVDGRRYSHTIDPRTGVPVDHELAAVTVVADRTAQADALATALLVLGPEHGHQFAVDNDIAALFLVRSNGDIAALESGAFAALGER